MLIHREEVWKSRIHYQNTSVNVFFIIESFDNKVESMVHSIIPLDEDANKYIDIYDSIAKSLYNKVRELDEDIYIDTDMSSVNENERKEQNNTNI